MRLRRLGFTVAELLVVIGIILMILAIVLAVYPAAKSSAKVAACKLNLHQIYAALEIYKSDYPNYEKVHENVDFPVEPMRDAWTLSQYLGDKASLYCPLCPDCARQKLASSYIFSVLPRKSSPLYSVALPQMNEKFGDPTTQRPVIHCLVHDEMEYFPRERDLDPNFNPPYVVWLTKDGVTKSGRYPVSRGHDIAFACASGK